MVDGQRDEPVVYLTGITTTPLDPADSQKARDLAFRLQQETGKMYELLQVFTESSNDIREGDVLVVSGREYPVRSTGDWTWRTTTYLQLLLEDPKP